MSTEDDWWDELRAADDQAVHDAGGFIFHYPNSPCGLAVCLYPDSPVFVCDLVREIDRGEIDLAACCQKELWNLMHFADRTDRELARRHEPSTSPIRRAWSELWHHLLVHLGPNSPLRDIACPEPGPRADWRPMSRTRPGQMELFA